MYQRKMHRINSICTPFCRQNIQINFRTAQHIGEFLLVRDMIYVGESLRIQ